METDPQTSNRRPLLRVLGLRKQYFRQRSLLHRRNPVCAVDGVDFEISAGKTLALVGNSGSGKSTVARCVTRLETPDAGEIWIGEREISHLRSCQLRSLRTEIQMIFQDPATSINPRFCAAQVIQEPLRIQKHADREYRRQRAEELMNEVGLSPAWAERRALDFSGGQRQRLAIARALALQPKILVLDEALSALDLAIQTQILNLLLDLQASRSLAYLFISHDLTLVARVADSIAVMSAGKIVEQGLTSAILSHPNHPQTQRLLASGHLSLSNFAAAAGATS